MASDTSSRTPGPRLIAFGLAAGLTATLVLVGCGGKSSGPTATTTSGNGAATTVAPPPDSTSDDTTSTTSSTTSSSIAAKPSPPPTPIKIPSPSDGTSPEGSGCSPAPGDTLPDGIWFGTLTDVDVAAGTIGLDLACFYVGEAANAAASAAGETDLPVPNGYYITDQSPKVYTMRVVDDVAVLPLAHKGGSTEFVPGSGLAAARASLDELPVRWIGWIQVTDGWVVVIQQQFVP